MKYWISTYWATGQVNTSKGTIIFAPPIWKKFIGQPYEKLIKWLESKGKVYTEIIGTMEGLF